MSEIQESIYTDLREGRQVLRIDSPGDYFFIEAFFCNCSSPELANWALAECQLALATNTSWTFHINDVLVSYDPVLQIVKGEYERSDVFIAPPSSISAPDFVRILSTWLEALSLTVRR